MRCGAVVWCGVVCAYNILWISLFHFNENMLKSDFRIHEYYLFWNFTTYLAMQSINDFTCSVYYANAKMQINLIQTHLKMGWKRHRCSRARLAIDRCVYSATPEFHVNNVLRQKRHSANSDFLKNEMKKNCGK